MPALARPIDQVDHAIAQRVRAWRMLRGIRQADLAASIGVTHQQIHKYEAGRSRIAASTLTRMASALHVRPADFFPGVNDRPTLSAEALYLAALIDQLDTPRRHLVRRLIESWE